MCVMLVDKCVMLVDKTVTKKQRKVKGIRLVTCPDCYHKMRITATNCGNCYSNAPISQKILSMTVKAVYGSLVATLSIALLLLAG